MSVVQVLLFVSWLQPPRWPCNHPRQKKPSSRPTVNLSHVHRHARPKYLNYSVRHVNQSESWTPLIDSPTQSKSKTSNLENTWTPLCAAMTSRSRRIWLTLSCTKSVNKYLMIMRRVLMEWISLCLPAVNVSATKPFNLSRWQSWYPRMCRKRRVSSRVSAHMLLTLGFQLMQRRRPIRRTLDDDWYWIAFAHISTKCGHEKRWFRYDDRPRPFT